MASLAFAFVVAAAMVSGVSCGPPKVPPGPNITAKYDSNWLEARATWYGKATGAGPDDNGGACGYKDVDKAPFLGMNSCGNDPIFKDGKGCGSCFEIKCTKPEACSDKPVIVHITDMNEEPIAAYHFDLSGKAFGALAKEGKEEELRKAGIIDTQFRRVRCKYPGDTKITFHVEKGSNPNYFALLVKYVGGDGDVVAVDLKEKGSEEYKELKESWGAIWRLDTPKPLKGPFTIRITTESGEKLIAEDIIPNDWKADALYKSELQLD
uniref:Expansin-like EG45 domain-containing protein n=1 Tax=Leersia perrieri TaxID=77586 RepID=A0A0D9VND4_9ORYZ